MQQPTLTGIRVRNVNDANLILHAVHLNILPMVHRRLDDEERLALRPGCVYVWEERSNNPLEVTGQEIQRFTEGRCWGPSRARDEFLLYYEKEGTGRSSMIQRLGGLGSQQLIKQTYSVFIDSPTNSRKWHLNAYYTQETHDSLCTVDAYPPLRNIRVPDGMYVCARSSSMRKAQRANRQRSMEEAGGQIQPISPMYVYNDRQDSSSPRSVDVPMGHSPRYTASTTYLSYPPSSQNLTLAPLEYLQNIPPPHRNPIDDEALRSFRPVARF